MDQILKLFAVILPFLSTLAKSTTTTLDDLAVSFLNAVKDSPALIQWAIDHLAKHEAAGIPDNALAQLDPSDSELAAAFNSSPAIREWAALQSSPETPAGTEPFAVGSVLTIIKFLPTLFTLIKAAKDAGLLGKGK